MPLKRSALLADEEPPISFYADLVEAGTVEVDYNESGGLMVTQGTQYDVEELKKEPWILPMAIKIVLVLCGAVTTYTIHRIAFRPIPCTCTNNCGPCVSPGIQLLQGLRSLWQNRISQP